MNYKETYKKWCQLWNSLNTNEWKHPWFDESWKDGNPIFSALNPDKKRGIRIIHHNNPDTFISYKDTFDGIEELVINCDSSVDYVFFNAKILLEEWVK